MSEEVGEDDVLKRYSVGGVLLADVMLSSSSQWVFPIRLISRMRAWSSLRSGLTPAQQLFSQDEQRTSRTSPSAQNQEE